MGLKEDFYELPPSKCLLIGFLLCVVYYILIFNKGDSFNEQLQKIQGEINDKTTRIEGVKKAIADTNAFEQQVKSLEKDFTELLKFFPVNMNMNDVQKEMAGLLSKNELQVASIKETVVQNRFEGYIENGFDIETISDFHQIMSFLTDITKMNKVVDFRAMEFNSDGSTDEASRIKFRMQFSIFSQDPNRVSKGEPAKTPEGK